MLGTAITTGCGETYINADATATTVDGTTTAETTLAPISPDASADELIDELSEQLSGLSETILNKDQPTAIQHRINDIWMVLEPKLDEEPATQVSIGTVVELANLAVDRQRPADADKAAKALGDVVRARG